MQRDAGIVSEFIEFDSDHAEAILSLLDCRFLAGDQELFSNLRNRMIPEVMVRESQALVERLAELTRNSHRKFANTVFHLEPNVKDGPGGFQDYVTRAGLPPFPPWKSSMAGRNPRHFFLPRSNCDGLGARFLRIRALLPPFP